MKNITTLLLGLFFLGSTTLSYGETVSFKYDASIIQSWGANGLAVGDTVTGDFTYVLGQTGHNVSLIVPGSMTRYVNGVFTAKAHNQEVRSTGGQVEVKNDVEAFGTVVWDGITVNVSDRYGSIKTGNINGYRLMDLQILLTNLIGQPFTSTALPSELDLLNYPSSRRFLMTFEGNGGGVIGELTLLEPCTLNTRAPYRGCVN
ncbi:MAG: hypothetical protein ACN4GM_11720 [Gammaproteobacteria bacterium]